MPLSFDNLPDESAATAPKFDDLPDESNKSSPSLMGNIANAASAAGSTINATLNPFSAAYQEAAKARAQNPSNALTDWMSAGRGLAAIPELIAAPFTGAVKTAAPAIATPMTKGIQAVGEPIAKALNPNAVLPSEQDVYSQIEPQVETAMGLAVPAKVKPVPIPGAPTAGPLGVTLSEGQASGDLSAIQREQAALRGTSGTAAQERAQAFADQQKGQVSDAKGAVARGLDPFGQEIAENPQQAGVLASQSVQSIAAARKAGVTQAYEQARAYPGEIHAGVFEGMGQGIKGDLTLGQSPVIIDDKLTPFASKMVDDLDNRITQLNIQNKADPFGPPDPQNVVGVNLAGVDQMRKRLSAFRQGAWGNNAADGRAASAVLDSFDNRIDEAVNGGLFNGSPQAVQAWNDARAAYSDYRGTFTAAKNDPVGRVVEKITGKNGIGPTASGAAIPNDVADYLYGAAGTNPSSLNVGVANRIKGILGDQSPEWSGVKQGLFRRLVEPGEGQTDWGPGKVAQRLNKFLNSDGVELSHTVFSPNERTMLQSYADMMRKMEVPQSGANWSNTATFMAKTVNNIGGKIGMMVGAALGRTVLPFAPPLVSEGLGAGAAMGAGKAAQAIQARAVAKQMPLVAEQVKRWQKAVARAQRINSGPSKALAATATLNLSRTLAPLGITMQQVAAQAPGVLNAQENQQNVPGPPGQHKNGGAIGQNNGFAHGGAIKGESGGNVKVSKEEAHYRAGGKEEKCARCRMFRSPDGCSAVAGKIEPSGVCDLFESKHLSHSRAVDSKTQRGHPARV